MTSSHYPFLHYFLISQMAQALRWDVVCERYSTDMPCLLMYTSHLCHRGFQGKGLVCEDGTCSWTRPSRSSFPRFCGWGMPESHSCHLVGLPKNTFSEDFLQNTPLLCYNTVFSNTERNFEWSTFQTALSLVEEGFIYEPLPGIQSKNCINGFEFRSVILLFYCL